MGPCIRCVLSGSVILMIIHRSFDASIFCFPSIFLIDRSLVHEANQTNLVCVRYFVFVMVMQGLGRGADR